MRWRGQKWGVSQERGGKDSREGNERGNGKAYWKEKERSRGEGVQQGRGPVCSNPVVLMVSWVCSHLFPGPQRH